MPPDWPSGAALTMPAILLLIAVPAAAAVVQGPLLRRRNDQARYKKTLVP
jgi:hypothetical protein